MTIVNTAAISRLLDPAVKSVFGLYETYNDEWKEIFKTQPSTRAFEFDVEMRYMGIAGIKPEGSPVGVDTMGQRSVTNYVHKCVANSIVLTKEALEDNQFKGDFPEKVRSMRDSLIAAKNTLSINILNNAFNPAFPIGDGQPLCSTAHPIDGGTFANTPSVAQAFSEGALEQAIIQIQSFPMASGILSQIKPRKAIVHRNNQFNAVRILESTFRVDTALNDVNAMYHKNYIPKGYAVNQYLQSPSAFFLLTDAECGLKHYQRTAVESFAYADPKTFSLEFTAMERYSFGASNCRSLWGSAGA